MAQAAQILQFSKRPKKLERVDANDRGWVKSYRKRLDETFSHCPIKYVVWDFLLLNATHKPYETRLGAIPITLMPGQLITSQSLILNQFSKSVLPVTRDHVRGALDLFVREGMITVEGSRKGSIITIVNWGKYQGETEPKNSDFSPQQLPNRIPQQKTEQEASDRGVLSDISPNSSPNTNSDQLPAIQEDNKYTTKHCSKPIHGSSVDETAPKKTASKFEYPEEFEWIWSNRPLREGSDPKRKAFHAANARIKQGATWRQLAEGMKRYTAFCTSKGWLNTGKVQQMATFFGPDEHYTNAWSVNAASGKPAARPALNVDDTSWADDLGDM